MKPLVSLSLGSRQSIVVHEAPRRCLMGILLNVEPWCRRLSRTPGRANLKASRGEVRHSTSDVRL